MVSETMCPWLDMQIKDEMDASKEYSLVANRVSDKTGLVPIVLHGISRDENKHEIQLRSMKRIFGCK